MAPLIKHTTGGKKSEFLSCDSFNKNNNKNKSSNNNNNNNKMNKNNKSKLFGHNMVSGPWLEFGPR